MQLCSFQTQNGPPLNILCYMGYKWRSSVTPRIFTDGDVSTLAKLCVIRVLVHVDLEKQCNDNEGVDMYDVENCNKNEI